MGKVFTMPTAVKSLITDVFDDLFTEFGKPCRFVYPPERTACSCASPATGFGPGDCQICSGAGHVDREVSEIVVMLLAWTPKDFALPIVGQPVVVPGGRFEAKLYLKDVPKLLRATRVVVQCPIEPLLEASYELAGEPFDPSNIIQGRYAVANFRRLQ